MNRIVVESSKTIRQQARFALQGRWLQAMSAIFIYMLFSLAIISPESFVEYNQYGEAVNMTPTLALAVFVTSIYSFFVTGAFTYGVSKYSLKVSRGQEAQVMTVFDGFTRVFKTMGLLLYITIKTLLWTLLFIIPGIVAGLRYSLAFYVMVENPDYSISQCVEESKVRMNGNKMKLFCLNFSFIGWALLVAAGTTAIASLLIPVFALMPLAVETVVFSFLVAIAMLPLCAYLILSNARFYDLTTPVNLGI